MIRSAPHLFGGEHGKETDRTVTDDRDGIARFYIGRIGGEPAGAHHGCGRFYTNLTGGPPTTLSAVEVDLPLMPADPPERDRLHDRLERSSARLCSR